MKDKPAKRNRPMRASKKIYTYRVICSFALQYSFTEAEVEKDPGGNESDLQPTEEAIRSLEKDLIETLGQSYAISDFETYAESDELLGISDEEGNRVSLDHDV